MIQAEVLTSWVIQNGAYVPKIAVDYGPYGLEACHDVTGQAAAVLLPSPNVMIVNILCSEKEFDLIKADTGCCVIWSGGDKESKMAGAELTAIKTWLKAQGFGTVQVADVAGAVLADRKREDVSQDIRTWLKANSKKAIS